jgi:hypothetical protein
MARFAACRVTSRKLEARTHVHPPRSVVVERTR